MSGEPGERQTGRIVAGIFLCLLGICMVVLGGGCTMLWLIFGTGGMSGLGPLLFLLCIAVFVAGIVVLRQAAKMFRIPPAPRSVARPDPEAPPEP